MEVLISFNSTHGAIYAEKRLLAQKIEVKVRPTPSYIKAGCGITLCISSIDLEIVENELKKERIEYIINSKKS